MDISSIKGLAVVAVGERGPNGDHHRYVVTGFNTLRNPTRCIEGKWHRPKTELHVVFQSGPLHEGQWNGITLETLLDIAIHRLEGCQTGAFRSHHNQVALNALTLAATALATRANIRTGEPQTPIDIERINQQLLECIK